MAIPDAEYHRMHVYYLRRPMSRSRNSIKSQSQQLYTSAKISKQYHYQNCSWQVWTLQRSVQSVKNKASAANGHSESMFSFLSDNWVSLGIYINPPRNAANTLGSSPRVALKEKMLAGTRHTQAKRTETLKYIMKSRKFMGSPPWKSLTIKNNLFIHVETTMFSPFPRLLFVFFFRRCSSVPLPIFRTMPSLE